MNKESEESEHHNQGDYLAFISYSHDEDAREDHVCALWLQEQLKNYSIPSELIGSENEKGQFIPELIYPIMREKNYPVDEADPLQEDKLDPSIVEGLGLSHFLIVVCSTKAILSDRVNKEISYFKRMGKEERILAVIVLDEPTEPVDHSPYRKSTDDSSILDSVPKSLKYEVLDNGEVDLLSPVAPILIKIYLPLGNKDIVTSCAYKKQLVKKGMSKSDIKRLVSKYEESLHQSKLRVVAYILGIHFLELEPRDKLYRLNQIRGDNRRTTLISVLGLATLVGGGIIHHQRWQQEQEMRSSSSTLIAPKQNIFLSQTNVVKEKINAKNEKRGIAVIKTAKGEALQDLTEKVKPQKISLVKNEPLEKLLQGKKTLASNLANLSKEVSKDHWQYKQDRVISKKSLVAKFVDGVAFSKKQHIATTLMKKADLFVNNKDASPESVLSLYQQSYDLFEALAKNNATDMLLQQNLLVLANKMGDFQLGVGQANDALAHYLSAIKMGEMLTVQEQGNIEFEHDLLVSSDNAGDAFIRLGQISNAFKHYQRALNIRKELVKKDPKHTLHLHDLSISYERLGDILLQQERADVAILYYQAGLDTDKQLVDLDRSNMQYQHNIAISSNNLGDVQLHLGKMNAAHHSYQAALDVSELLVMQEAESTEFQYDLWLSINNVANVQKQKGKVSATIKSYQTSLAVCKTLLKKGPDNLLFQRNFSNTYDQLGHAELRAGKSGVALEYYQSALAVRQKGLENEVESRSYQHDVSLSYQNIGKVLLRQKKLKASLLSYQKEKEILNDLVKKEPKNVQFRKELSIAHNKEGEVLLRLGKNDLAVKAYQSGLMIRESLFRDSLTQRDLSVSYENLGNIQLGLGKTEAALHYYQSGMEVSKRLLKQEPKNQQFQRLMLVSNIKLGETYMQMKEVDLALNYFQMGLTTGEELVRENPKDATLQHEIAVFYWKIAEGFYAQKNYKEAIIYGQKVVSTLPKKDDLLADALTSLSWYQILRGDFEGAQNSSQKANIINPKDTISGVNLAHAHLLRQHDFNKVKGYYLKTVGYIKSEKELQQGAIADIQSFIKLGLCQTADCEKILAWLPLAWKAAQ
ncbi:MAG: TIR domain-containing protein [Methylococcales bacterium]|nr:TIR domain-containing protein [Methylococcales bacterium]